VLWDFAAAAVHAGREGLADIGEATIRKEMDLQKTAIRR
jgi:copper oxidase (laccase) domain-containing protein